MAKIVTAKQVAAYLQFTPNTIINLAVKGDLPGFKVGRSWRFDMDEILQKIEEIKKHSVEKQEGDFPNGCGQKPEEV